MSSDPYNPETRPIGGTSPAKDWLTAVTLRMKLKPAGFMSLGLPPNMIEYDHIINALVEYVEVLEERLAQVERGVKIVSGPEGYIE